MIMPWNRRETAVTMDLKQQAEIRDILASHGIEYQVKTTSLARRRGQTGSLGLDLAYAYEYKIYVHQKDYAQASRLLQK